MGELSIFPPGDGTLVVVDPQWQFVNASKATKDALEEVLLEIEQAMSLGWFIIVLAMKPRQFGAIDQRVLDKLANYAHASSIAQKKENDGSSVIEAAWGGRNDTGCFRICGYNSHACVSETAAGLRRIYPHARVEVAVPACGTWLSDYNWFEWDDQSLSGVLLLDRHRQAVVPGEMTDEHWAQLEREFFPALGR